MNLRKIRRLLAVLASTCVAFFAANVQAQGVLIPITVGNVSGELTPKGNAADGNPATSWNSGGPATQWIDIDLGSEKTVSRIRMMPEQAPGNTSHNVYGRTSTGVWYNFGHISSFSYDGQWLTVDVSNRIPVRYLIVQTTRSPSWIAWREFEVYEGGEMETRCTIDSYGQWAIVDITPGGCPQYINNRTYHYLNLTKFPKDYVLSACFHLNSNDWEYLGTPASGSPCLGVRGNRSNWRRK